MSQRSFDLVVIGTGSAAASAASPCRSAGWEVAVVDSRPFGGTCALRGCDPKKVLVGEAEVVDAHRRLREHGIDGDAAIDWPEAMRFKRSFTEPVSEQRREAFEKAGIVALRGRARFTGRDTLEVDGDTLEARHFVVAAGMRPAPLAFDGADLLLTSTDFLELDRLPERLVFVGGGFISFEFAHVAARAGARATILHRGKRPLGPFDPDLVERLVERTRALGIEVRLESEPTAVRRQGNRLLVQLEGGETLEADAVVHGAGRVPEIDDLALDRAGVEADRRGVKVNEFLQSVSNPAVYAAGDAAASGGPPLTPVAGYEGRLVADNLLHGNRSKPDYSGAASVAFTLPPLARAGLTEREARERGVDFEVHHRDTSGWYSSRRVGEQHSAYKVLVEKGSGRLLGAHLLGPHADEQINVFAFAIRHGLGAEAIRDTLFAYPTHGSDLRYMVG